MEDRGYTARRMAGWLSEDLYRGNRERNDLSRALGEPFPRARCASLASLMHKPHRCTSTHVTEQTRYCDDARTREDGGGGSKRDISSLARSAAVMGSVSGPVAEIIRSDSRIIKERISTRRLPRIISGLRSSL